MPSKNMQDIPDKDYFNTIQRPENARLAFLPGILFSLVTGWEVILIAHNKAAASVPERASHLVYTSVTATALRATPEEALSPEVLQSILRKMGLFDSCQKRVWTSDFRKDGMAWVVWFGSGFCAYAYTDNTSGTTFGQ